MTAFSWFQTYTRPASFRGVPFYVETASKSLGRQAVTHLFPNKDWPYHEDLGRAPRKFQLDVLLVGDDILAQVAALEAALETAGPGELIHPYYGTLQVVAVGEASTRFALTDSRVARVSVSFEQDAANLQASPIPTAGTAADVLADAEQALGALLSDVADALDLTGVVDFVVNDALAVAQDVASAVQSVLGAVGAFLALPDLALSEALALASDALAVPAQFLGPVLDGSALIMGLLSDNGLDSQEAQYGGQIANIFDSFAGLVPDGRAASGDSASLIAAIPAPIPASGNPTAAATLVAAAANLSAAATLIAAAVPATGAASASAPAPLPVVPAALAMPALLRLAGDGTPTNPGYTPAITIPSVAITPARQLQITNRTAIVTLVRATAAIEAAVISARTLYTSRDQVLTARDALSDALDASADAVGNLGWTATWQAITQLRAAVTRDLTQTAAPLPALTTVRLGAVLPAAVLAYRLYGDGDLGNLFAERADLVARNTVSHPGFLPAAQDLGALASWR
jgi:prophage DNA circulation protein